jgi:hypothetical protein
MLKPAQTHVFAMPANLHLMQDEKEAGDRHVLWLSEKLEAVTGRAERLEESLAQAEHELAKTQEQASTIYTHG